MENHYICVVRVYQSKNRVFDGTKRALLVCSKNYKVGTVISFLFQGVKKYGDVLFCAPVPEHSAISIALRMLSDVDVFVYVHPGLELEETATTEAAADEED